MNTTTKRTDIRAANENDDFDCAVAAILNEDFTTGTGLVPESGRRLQAAARAYFTSQRHRFIGLE